jgi:hypothetical protein
MGHAVIINKKNKIKKEDIGVTTEETSGRNSVVGKD